MNRFQKLVVYAAAVAFSGVVTVKSVEPGSTPGQATVKSVKGYAEYSEAGGQMIPLKANTVLNAGATIKTGPDALVYVSVNGLSSAVRIASDSTLVIPKMDKIGPGREADTETELNLKNGSIVGQVRKVSANSTYEIKTPHGIAGIRGTDFNITVVAQPGGGFTVTFTSIQGIVIASAVINASGQVQTVTLHDGQSWTPGEGVVPCAVELLTTYQNQIQDLINNGGGTIIVGPTPGPKGPPILPVFSTGTPPGQGSSSDGVTPSGGGTTTGGGP